MVTAPLSMYPYEDGDCDGDGDIDGGGDGDGGDGDIDSGGDSDGDACFCTMQNTFTSTGYTTASSSGLSSIPLPRRPDWSTNLSRRLMGTRRCRLE